MTEITKIIYPLFLEHPVISTDSRRVQPESLFFALKGASFNGNEFAARALAEGALFAFVDDPTYVVNERCILVKDVLSALQDLARHHRMQFNIPVVGITGTNGKTTTKELAYAVLSEKYQTLATKGNFNNHLGVPLTLLNLTKETEIALVEMGANHPGEIDFLCRIAQPDFGLITNIGKAHLEGFGGFEGVVSTKTELYRYLQQNGGRIFLNNQDGLLKKHITGTNVITHGTFPADIVATCITADPFVTMQLQFRDQTTLIVESKLYGRYNASNILAAASIGRQFNVPPAQIKAAIEAYQPDNNRSQITKTENNLLILDAYNANPDSMEAALTTFAETDYPEKTVILGDMLELGTESDHEHQRMLELLDHLGFTRAYLVGPVFTRMNKTRKNICFHDNELAKIWLEHHKIMDATILIKGSRGIKLEKLVEVL